MSGKKDGKEIQEADCECYAESRTKKTCPPIRRVTHPLRYYEFTQEEIRALEECDRESFYLRCIPFSTLFASVTYAAVKYGHLNSNPHFGAVPKVMAAAFFGYCLGRLSYMSACEKKLRKLPDSSHLGNIMRKYHLENYSPPDLKKRS